MHFPPILDRLQDCEDPPFTQERLEELQRALGVRFPKDYAEFLLRFNGGDFSLGVEFDMPIPTEWVTGASVDGFIGQADDEDCEFLDQMEEFREFISDPCVPIANCNSGDFVVLKFSGSDLKFDGVWFWDSGADPDDDEQILHPVADSFTSFLTMLNFGDDGEEEQETIPIFQAVERGGLTAMEQYLAKGGNPNQRNAKGQTLLAAAAIYRWPQIVRQLLDHSADPNARDKQGRTPLYHAARHSLDSVKLLLAAGADAKVRDNKGKGVLAQWCFRTDDLLRAHGAEE
jgi:hypothetical protein